MLNYSGCPLNEPCWFCVWPASPLLRPPACASACQAVYASLSLSLSLSLPLSISLSLFCCPSVALSLCLSLCLPLSLPCSLSLSVSLSRWLCRCLPLSFFVSLSPECQRARVTWWLCGACFCLRIALPSQGDQKKKPSEFILDSFGDFHSAHRVVVIRRRSSVVDRRSSVVGRGSSAVHFTRYTHCADSGNPGVPYRGPLGGHSILCTSLRVLVLPLLFLFAILFESLLPSSLSAAASPADDALCSHGASVTAPSHLPTAPRARGPQGVDV